MTQVPEIALLELDTACDVGCKTDSKGNKNYWIGYKFHVRVAEGNLPLLAVTTAASVHDSQVDIPLMKMTDRLVTSLYELKDRAYDAKCIRLASEQAGHVPIIDYIKRRGQERARELEPDRAEHYKGRTVVERFNARLKDEFGGNMVRVRGNRKVHAHLMCGLLVIFADQLLRYSHISEMTRCEAGAGGEAVVSTSSRTQYKGFVRGNFAFFSLKQLVGMLGNSIFLEVICNQPLEANELKSSAFFSIV